jgi:density-regulated protein DRP1
MSDANSGAASSKSYLTHSGPAADLKYPLVVDYCGECGLPVELCEFSPDPQRCRQWLEQHLPQRLERLTTGDADRAEGGEPEKRSQKRGGKGMPRAPKSEPPPAPPVEISRKERAARKFVTTVSGLQANGVDLKAAAKLFGSRFACGCTARPDADEILIQGDVADDLPAIISSKYPQIPTDHIHVPE